MKIIVDLDECQKRFDELIELARRGDQVIITKDYQPMWHMEPISEEEAERIKAEMGWTEQG